jgi:riboflavin synthase
MFTGIIEEQGIIVSIVRTGQSVQLKISCEVVLNGLKEGDSIAVDGVCLTVVMMDTGSCHPSDCFTADVMPETFRRTTFRLLHTGSRVNLERAMKADGRFGGHIVTGHVDGTGTVYSATHDGNAIVYMFTASPPVVCGIIEKGSVAIDGISLTVVSVRIEPDSRGMFSVSVIPHTCGHTSLSAKRRGSMVNIECDVFGKYVARFFELRNSLPKLYDIEGKIIWNRKTLEQDLLQ